MWYSFFMFLPFLNLQSSTQSSTVLFDQGVVSTKHDFESHRARLLRLPRSHISPISSPLLAFLTIRPWRETSCAGGESTRHRLSQRSLWTGDGKTDKVFAGSTPSQTDCFPPPLAAWCECHRIVLGRAIDHAWCFPDIAVSGGLHTYTTSPLHSACLVQKRSIQYAMLAAQQIVWPIYPAVLPPDFHYMSLLALPSLAVRLPRSVLTPD